MCDAGTWGGACENSCPGGVSNPCGGNGVCGLRGTCTCRAGWGGWKCTEKVGAIGVAKAASLAGSWTGLITILPDGWGPSPAAIQSGITGGFNPLLLNPLPSNIPCALPPEPNPPGWFLCVIHALDHTSRAPPPGSCSEPPPRTTQPPEP